MAERLIIANLKYINAKRIGRGHGSKGLRSALKYLTYREDRDTRVLADSNERWVDRGLGVHRKEIQQQCAALQSDKVLAWTWVISPEPDLMALLPVEQRLTFIKDLTEAIVERYYDARNVEAAYSYVVHEATTKDGRPHTHTHVMLPGTAWSALEGRVPMTNYQRKGHLTLLDEIGHEELTQALDVALGREWRQDLGLEPDDVNDLEAWFPR